MLLGQAGAFLKSIDPPGTEFGQILGSLCQSAGESNYTCVRNISLDATTMYQAIIFNGGNATAAAEITYRTYDQGAAGASNRMQA